MLTRRWVIATALALGLAGCSAIINPDEGRLGRDTDAGPGGGMDAGPGDAGPGVDAGPGEDAGQSMCESADPFCRGDGLVTCVGGFEQVVGCQAQQAFCEDGECRAWECVPNSRECNGGRSAVVACNARGNGSDEIDCDPGVCNETTGSCEGIGPTRCESHPSIALGDNARIDLCREMDTNTHRTQGECDGSFRASAGDRIYRLEVPTDGLVTIELEDEDPLNPIDVVVYLRRVCDEADTQIACDDYTPCEGGIFPNCRMGRNEERAKIDVALTAGTYYIVVDAFLYNAGDGRRSVCGTVELRVRSF